MSVAGGPAHLGSRSPALRVARGLILLAIVVWTLFPIYYMVVLSFTPTAQLFRPGYFVAQPTLESYRFILFQESVFVKLRTFEGIAPPLDRLSGNTEDQVEVDSTEAVAAGQRDARCDVVRRVQPFEHGQVVGVKRLGAHGQPIHASSRQQG